jgi:hypothetical protein
MLYNVYCDESCHLQKDSSTVMVLGAMYCLNEKKNKIYADIRAIKKKHGLSSRLEIKWTKVSESKIDFYLELLEYFWNNDDLHYRGLVATGKDKLDHAKYNDGDYDLWYYKMYFRTLDPIIRQENEYHILVDIKDTRGGKRVQKLKQVLCNNIYDFNGEVITHIGQINSKESEILQLADLINGALAYHYRGLEDNANSNMGKVDFVKALQEKQNIDKRTSRYASKFNLFVWSPDR